MIKCWWRCYSNIQMVQRQKVRPSQNGGWSSQVPCQPRPTHRQVARRGRGTKVLQEVIGLDSFFNQHRNQFRERLKAWPSFFVMFQTQIRFLKNGTMIKLQNTPFWHNRQPLLHFFCTQQKQFERGHLYIFTTRIILPRNLQYHSSHILHTYLAGNHAQKKEDWWAKARHLRSKLLWRNCGSLGSSLASAETSKLNLWRKAHCQWTSNRNLPVGHHISSYFHQFLSCLSRVQNHLFGPVEWICETIGRRRGTFDKIGGLCPTDVASWMDSSQLEIMPTWIVWPTLWHNQPIFWDHVPIAP